jgi:ubiquinol-cytochrome c reductase cytochrome b subunit
MLGHPDNYLVSSAVVTPPHIVPEWYFLPLYAILRSVTSKLSGIIILALAFICLFSLPYLFNHFGVIRSIYYKPQLKLIIIFFIFNSLFLGWVGGQPVIEPFFFMGKIATCLYFLIFFVSSFSNIIEQFISKRGRRPNKLKLIFTY